MATATEPETEGRGRHQDDPNGRRNAPSVCDLGTPPLDTDLELPLEISPASNWTPGAPPER